MRKYKVLKWYPYKGEVEYIESIVVGVYTLDDVIDSVITHIKNHYGTFGYDVSEDAFEIEEFNLNDWIPNLYEKLED